MHITVNGIEHPLPANHTITGLLTTLGLDSKPVVVELNKTALFPRDYPTTTLTEGDIVEIITIAAGG